jgi:hypothetical protein
VSFELEFLRLEKDGKATVIDREHCPLDLALAKIKAQHILDEKRTDGGGIDAIRIRDAAGEEILLYRDGGNS